MTPTPAPACAEVLALVVDGRSVSEAQIGDRVEVILPKTGFYVEAGGQVSDTGRIYLPPTPTAAKAAGKSK